MKLWLDDMRPAPPGWQWAKTVDEAKAMILSQAVTDASLDHDLGACADCLKGRTPEQWLEETQYTAMPHCDHFGTGYNLVCWMEETGARVQNKPTVHSRNPAGRARMQQVLDKLYDQGATP